MKISKYLILGVAALSLVSCEKDDPTFANYIPPKVTEDPGTDEPTGPEIPAGAVKAEVTINKDQTYQTIKGFAASDCWAPHFVGKNWTDTRDAIARLLFDKSGTGATTQGIGLSMWRMNLGAGSLEQGAASDITNDGRRAESYRKAETTDEYDWNKCEGQRYWMEQARQYGVESFVFFSNSPLVQYTYNKKARSDRGAKNSNLRSNFYPQFAKYMADVAAHFKAEGYNITHISPFNEPQYDWAGHDQEGSGWSVAQQAKIVRELDKALTANGSNDIYILPGEAASWKELYESDKILENYYTPGGANYIGDLAHVQNNLVCGHSYWTDNSWNDMNSVRASVANEASKFNAEVWQSEWSMLTENYDTNEFPGYADATEMDNSIQMSRVIHKDLTVANCTSWSYWTSMDATNADHKNRFVLIRLLPDDGDYTEGTGTFETTPNLWVLGNYSLCIRPNYVRVECNVANESVHFFGSSYLAPDNSRLVSVYTNNTENPFYLADEFEGRDQVKAIKTYTTNETSQLAPDNVRVKDYVVIAPKSVVTVVYDL